MLNTNYIDNVLLHISAKCNCNCSHCYVKPFCQLPSIENKLEDIIPILKRISKPIHITGGEVMFLENFEKWVELLLKNQLNLTTVYSNGTLVEEHLEFIKQLYHTTPQIRFIISLDGVEDAHSSFRRTDSSMFTKTLIGIRLLKKIGFRVFINTMVHSNTTFENLEKLHNIIVKNNLDRWRIDRPFAMGNWIDNRKDQISWEKSFELFSHIVKLWGDSGCLYDLEIDHTFKYLNKKISVFDKYSLDDPICPCRAFPIWPNGDITWCQILHNPQEIIGNIFSTPLEQLIESYNFFKKKRIADFVKNKECETCALLPYCGAGCRANSMMAGGDMDEPDPEFCDIFKKKLQKMVLMPLFERIALR